MFSPFLRRITASTAADNPVQQAVSRPSKDISGVILAKKHGSLQYFSSLMFANTYTKVIKRYVILRVHTEP
jgi:hypothetical protein